MPDQNIRPGDAPQQAGGSTAAEPVRLGRDDPAPIPPQQAEATPKPPPRRDNQAEAISGVPIV